MAAPVMLRVILGENDSTRLTLPNGIPESVDDLIRHIKNQLELEGDIRLQFMDQEFGNEFNNLTSTSEIEDKSTIKVIHQPFIIIAGNHLDDSTPPSPHSSCPPPPFPSPYPSSSSLSTSPSIASCDTDILSSPEASSSRSSAWPLIFKVPRFPYDAELELEKANAALKDDGTLLDPGTKLKSSILNGLMEEIMKYKVYPSDTELGEIAEALVTTHPCLKEPGSKTGYEGWKTSLRWKIGNYRTRLRRLGHPEVAVNAQTNKRVGSSPASGVKKARKAEVNFCPALPSGETMDTQESKRVALLSEVDKRNNESHVTQLMDQTFSLRRQEVMQEPLIAEFKTRWPALFTVREVCAEFRRITTVNLESKFFFNLDAYSPNLMKAFSRKGGSVGQSLRRIMLPISQDSDINVRRECILKGLCTYFKEDPGKLLKEYMAQDADTESALAETVHAIYVIRHEGAEPGDSPEDIGIIVEGVTVIDALPNVPFAVAIFLALVYAMNLCYPPELKNTFEALQKIMLDLDGNRMGRKVQVLKTILSR